MKTENLYMPDCIRTYTGKYVNVLTATVDDIDIVDIAHALSMQPRFGGHLPRQYTVAQHSIFVCGLVAPESRLQALLHDATEAYLIDIPAPIKQLPAFKEYREIEKQLAKVIGEKFNVELAELHSDVRIADMVALRYEWENIMLEKALINIPVCPPEQARTLFLRCFNSLT